CRAVGDMGTRLIASFGSTGVLGQSRERSLYSLFFDLVIRARPSRGALCKRRHGADLCPAPCCDIPSHSFLGGAPIMPIPAERVINPQQVRNFGAIGDAIEVPPLTDVQTRSYDRFLQLEAVPEKRTPTGLEGVLREIFPIESYDKTISLEFLKYEL